MAAESSAYDSAPESDIRPPVTQTTKTMPGEPTFRIMTFGTMKIPLPITVPTTIATALHNPKSRLSETAAGALMNWSFYNTRRRLPARPGTKYLAQASNGLQCFVRLD